MIGEAGRATAEQVLDDTCTITRLDGDAAWVPSDPLPSATDEVYAGPCALLAPQDRRQSDGGGDERIRATRTLLLPVGAGPFRNADVVAVASSTDPFFVVDGGERSHRVLQRIQVASTLDAEGVPR